MLYLNSNIQIHNLMSGRTPLWLNLLALGSENWLVILAPLSHVPLGKLLNFPELQWLPLYKEKKEYYYLLHRVVARIKQIMCAGHTILL